MLYKKTNAKLIRLKTIGKLIQLYEFCQNRSQAVLKMKAALPLIDVHHFTMALDILMAAVTNLILGSLRYITQLHSQCTSLEQELLYRRVLDVGNYFLNSIRLHEPERGRILGFEALVNNVRQDLTILYQEGGESFETVRLQTTASNCKPYLHGYGMDGLNRLAEELCGTLEVVSKDIATQYRDNLAPEGQLQLCGSHLAMLCSRQGENIAPSTCGMAPTAEMTGRNVLHLAAETEDLPFLKWAANVRKRAGYFALEDRDKFRLTPLMIAAYTGCLNTFRFLLDQGADLNAQHPSGRSILCLASMAGHEAIVTEIFTRGVGIQDCIQFCSPIHDAAACGRSKNVIQVLLENKAEPRDERAEHGNRCASQIARDGQHEALAKILEEAEAQLERKLPTRDDAAQTIQSLKRLISDEMARSKSPESPSSRRPTDRRFASPERGRPRKRQKSIGPEWNIRVLAASSASSTPRIHPNTPLVPSPLSQNMIDNYNTSTLPDMGPDVLDSDLDFMLASDGQYEQYLEDNFS